MTILFTNNASTSLASGITSGATSLTVATGQGALFPTITGSNIFYLTLQNQAGTTPIEIVKVTALSGDTMTIVRGQDNTTASAFNAGDKVELRLPAVVLQDFPQLDVSNTFTVDQSISGLTVGKGGGSLSLNTAVGNGALAGANSGTGRNNAFGYQALNTNSTGYYCNAFGMYSLFSNTTGIANDAFGYSSLTNNTTGSNNVAIGLSSLASNTTASNNTAVGYQAGYSNTTGAGCVFIGQNAGYASTGSANTCIGQSTGYSLTTGYRNTFVGVSNQVTGAAGGLITTGNNNTIIGGYTGNQGGLDIRTASNYIVLSDGDGNPRGIFDSSGNFLVGKTSTATTALGWNLSPIAGNAKFDTGQYFVFNRDTNDILINFRRSDTSVGNINVTTTATAYVTSSDYRLKEEVKPMSNALDKIAQLKPCTYKWKIDGSDGEGFIAHELAEVVPQAVSGEKDAINEDGTIKAQGIDTSFLVATLVAAIQELKAEIDQLKGVK